jgi:hypothetical protein
MAKKKARRSSGETSVADAINESNGNGHSHDEQLPMDRRNFFITSEQNRRRFTWIIATCTGLMGLLTVYTNVVRDDQTQAIDIKALQTKQGEITVQIKEHHKTTQAQIKETAKEAAAQNKETAKEAAKVPAENAKSLQRLETMQAVVLQRLNELRQ